MSSRAEHREPVHAPLEQPAQLLAVPLRNFINAQTSAGWLLLAATLLAIALANSPFQSQYLQLQQLQFGILLTEYRLQMSLQHWVNECLMALFFFLLGLELKRELLVGELADLQRASSVIFAAAGGMLVPVCFYLLFANEPEIRAGWAIPVATDTAFALMLLVLLGKHVPPAARAFLVGLAIVDDLGAIVIIAINYTADFETTMLLPAMATGLVLVGLNLIGVRNGWPYLLAGAVLWLLFLQLGLHGTLAGVAAALTAPVRPQIERPVFVARLRNRIRRFERSRSDTTRTIFEQPEQLELAKEIHQVAAEATAPLKRWESRLERPISFLVMPLFAFMNAGFELSAATIVAAWSNELSLAIFTGLLLGKPLGILAGVLVGQRLGLARLPAELSWRHILGIGMLGSIGFTMSLFIAALSFGAGSDLLDTAKQSIIFTSLGGALLGFIWLRWCCPSAAGEG